MFPPRPPPEHETPRPEELPPLALLPPAPTVIVFAPTVPVTDVFSIMPPAPPPPEVLVLPPPEPPPATTSTRNGCEFPVMVNVLLPVDVNE